MTKDIRNQAGRRRGGSRRIGAVLAFIALSGCGGAREATRAAAASDVMEPPALRPEDVVTISIAGARDACAVSVTLHVARGYHVMSDRPSTPSFIATRVIIDAKDVALGSPEYPPSTPFTLGAESIATFEGDTRVVVPCVASSATSADARTRTVDVSVRYQACTRTRCLFPVTRTSRGEVTLAATTHSPAIETQGADHDHR